MKLSLFTSSIAAALLTALVEGQRITTTLPWADGNTLVISIGTNALGLPVTQTISTVAAGAVTSSASSTGLLNPAIPVTSSSSSSRNPLLATSSSSTQAGAVPVNTATSTNQGQIAYDTTTTNGPPMRTTTYWYDPGGGVWTVATWTASVTDAPDVATVIVPSGTMQDYNAYQSEINAEVLSSAQAAQTLLANGTSGAERRATVVGLTGAPWGALAGWSAMVVGMAGMGYGVLAL